MRRRIACLAGFALGLIVGCSGPIGGGGGHGGGSNGGDPADPSRFAYVAADDPLGEPVKKVVYLEQNWSPAQSLRFYFTSQGSHLIPYDWFLALEQPDSQEPFRDSRNMLKYRYLPQNPSPSNPDGLPVGFVADDGVDRRWLGFTCAACHTNEMRLGDVAYRVDGAPTLADVQALLSDLVLALRQTRDDDAKFKRFAAKVGAKDEAILRADLATMIQIRDGYNQRNFLGYDPDASTPSHPNMYGYLDAVDSIVNEVFWRTVANPDPKNPTVVAKPCNARVSYPFLWDTPQHDLVEWLGIAPNGNFGSSLGPPLGEFSGLPRNVGEVLGVFGDFVVHDDPGSLLNLGYSSSVRFQALLELNEELKTLWSPAWPADFPKIDRDAAALGAKLYARPSKPDAKDSCLDCHAIVNRKTLDRDRIGIRAFMADTGTDPQAYLNFNDQLRPSGRLAGVSFLGGPKIFPNSQAAPVLTTIVKGVIVGFYRSAPPDPLKDYRFNPQAGLAAARPEAKYKGRPLDGIWATAPYLHNGSVPTLDDLLKPAAERPTSFSIGVRTFDPEKVGYKTDMPGFPKFEVFGSDGKPIAGRSNAGHEYGTWMSPEERKQLLEYLKTL